MPWPGLPGYAQGGCGLLIDVGSTTTDVIPLVDAWPAAQGLTDPQRLLSGELIYTGVERTPICGLVETLPWAGRMCPVAREVSATALDAYLMLEDLAEQPDCRQTADGRPATGLAARDRLARQICADRTMFTHDDALVAARTIAERQQAEIVRALAKVIARQPSPPTTVILSGQGEFLARRAVEQLGLSAEMVLLSDQLGSVASTAATAYALAVWPVKLGAMPRPAIRMSAGDERRQEADRCDEFASRQTRGEACSTCLAWPSDCGRGCRASPPRRRRPWWSRAGAFWPTRSAGPSACTVLTTRRPIDSAWKRWASQFG